MSGPLPAVLYADQINIEEMETTDEYKPFDILPDELLLYIFTVISFRPGEYVRFSLVCKNWHACAHDDMIGRRFIEPLSNCYLIPTFPNILQKNGWALFKEIYHSRCEIYVDTSDSMGVRNRSVNKTTLFPAAQEKIKEVLTKTLSVLKALELFSFANTIEGPLKLTPASSIQKNIDQINACGTGTSLSFLTDRLVTYAHQAEIDAIQNQAEREELPIRMNTIFVISDLAIPSEQTDLLFAQIKKIHQLVLEHQNLNLVFIETSKKTGKSIKFITRLNEFMMKKK